MFFIFFINKFAERLKLLREGKRMSQTALAKELNVTKSMISAYESGARAPSLETVVLIAEYFGVSLDYMLGRDDQQHSDNSREYLDVTNLSKSQQGALQHLIAEFIKANEEIERIGKDGGCVEYVDNYDYYGDKKTNKKQ